MLKKVTVMPSWISTGLFYRENSNSEDHQMRHKDDPKKNVSGNSRLFWPINPNIHIIMRAKKNVFLGTT